MPLQIAQVKRMCDRAGVKTKGCAHVSPRALCVRGCMSECAAARIAGEGDTSVSVPMLGTQQLRCASNLHKSHAYDAPTPLRMHT